jgi:SAM-dependent methyltransferase
MAHSVKIMAKCLLCAAQGAEKLTDPPNYWHCKVCELRFLDTALRLKSEAEKARYDTHQNDNQGYENFLAPLFEQLSSRLAPGAQGLDFGAGPAPTLARLFRRHGFTVEPYDPFYCPNLEALERTYDFVVSSEVVEHFYDPSKEFRRIYNLLKPGAWLGIMTEVYLPRIDFAHWPYRRDPTHVVFYARETFQWLAEHFAFINLTYVGERIVLLQRAPSTK